MCIKKLDMIELKQFLGGQSIHQMTKDVTYSCVFLTSSGHNST